MADGGGQVPREVPSVALDRLFLELHGQLPRDARGKLAQLADEVKRLAESSTADAPVTPPSSADQVVVRRDEEIATAEAKQSSGELQAQGTTVTSLSDQPTLKDVVCFAEPRVAAKWYNLGLALDIQPFVLDGVAHQQEKADRPREMFAKWLEGSPGTGSQPRTWQAVLDAVRMICGSAAVEDIRTAVQTPRIPTAGDLEESKTTERSSAIELSRKRRRSSTRSSDDLVLQQSVAKKSLPDYMSIKMDLLARDMSDLHSESDPEVIIKLLYGNALATISDLLKPHLKTVKEAAGRYHRLGVHHVAVGEDIIESADSIDRLMSRMSVGGKWDQTRFLRKAISSIPHPAPERGIAEAVLSHYHLHLAIYEQSTLLKDALTEKSESEEESAEEKKLAPLKITSSKAFESFSCDNCHILQVQVLKKAYGIPDEKIICREVEDGHSTTVTFMILHQYVHNVIQHSGRLDTIWILLELDIIEVSIPGVFTFTPSVGCFLSLLKGSKPFTADLLRVTEVLPYQMYCLLDSDIREPLSGRPLSVKRIEQRWDSHDEFPLSDAQSEDDATQAMLSDEAAIPPAGSVSVLSESQSRVLCELEERVNDLEQRASTIFTDNAQQQAEFTRLKERLAEALESEETATRELSLLKTKKPHLEHKMGSDLEMTAGELQKQMMELAEILPSDAGLFKEGPSSDQKAVAKYKVEEEARKGSKGETSAVPDQVTGGPTAATRGSQPPTQVVAASPVIVAAKSGQLSTLRKLLDGGAGTVEDRDEEGMTALLWASYKGHLPVVRELVKVYKADLFQKNKNGRNAMHMAAEGGHIEVIKFLLPLFGERVHEKTNNSYTMLHFAAEGGHCQVARYLIEEVHLDTQDRDKWGTTALLRAAYGGSVPLVRALLEDYGSSVDELTENGKNAMHKAAQGGHIEVIKFLLPLFGERVHEKDNDSYTMLHVAAQGGHCQVARYLIEEVHLNPQDRDKWGYTALLRAAYGGSVPLVRALLEDYGSSVDELDEKGLNALHVAADCGHLELVKFLIPIFGEKKFAVTHYGDTCLTLAIKEQKEDVVEYLVQEGGFGRQH